MWIQGAVDGFSRKIIYLKATNSNSSMATAHHFVDACLQHHIPGRIRTDHGTENGLVKEFINSVNGDERNSCIMGKSTANERIERLWKDVFAQCGIEFYKLFYLLEERRLYDDESEIDRFCLQYVMLPTLDRFINEWKQAWNERPSKALGGKSPNTVWQLSIEDSIQNVGLATHRGVLNVLNPPQEAFRLAKERLNIHDNPFLAPRTNNPLNLDASSRLRPIVDDFT